MGQDSEGPEGGSRSSARGPTFPREELFFVFGILAVR